MKAVTLIVPMLLTAAAHAADGAATPAPLEPFVASYQIVWRGFNAGTTELELTRAAPDQFVYASRSRARGLFRMFFSDVITQTSWFTRTGSGVRPTRYRADDGSDNTERDIALDFDWQAGRAHGIAEDKVVDVALEPGAQDAMSIQIAMLCDLLSGAQPSRYRLLDKDRIKEYRYTYEGEARLQTVLGEVDTVIYRSEREGSSRVTRMWYAPALGHVAVRGEQLRDGKREWFMELRSLKRG